MLGFQFSGQKVSDGTNSRFVTLYIFFSLFFVFDTFTQRASLPSRILAEYKPYHVTLKLTISSLSFILVDQSKRKTLNIQTLYLPSIFLEGQTVLKRVPISHGFLGLPKNCFTRKSCYCNCRRSPNNAKIPICAYIGQNRGSRGLR